jgi:hypothetical protein
MPRLAPSALVPAAARAPELLTDVETELNIRAVEQFTAQLGGREQLTSALAVAEGDVGVEKVLTYLLDPRYDRWSLPRICRLAGLTIADFFIAYKRAVLAKAHIEATHIIAANLPPIVEDVMRLARTEPTVERQKLALELGQLTEKRGGIVVQQNAIAATVSNHAPGALEQFQQVVGDLLFSPRKKAPPIETEEEDLPPIGDPADPDEGESEDPGLPDAVRDAPLVDPPEPEPSPS